MSLLEGAEGAEVPKVQKVRRCRRRRMQKEPPLQCGVVGALITHEKHRRDWAVAAVAWHGSLD